MMAVFIAIVMGGIITFAINGIFGDMIFRNKDLEKLASKRNEEVLNNLFHFVDIKSGDEVKIYKEIKYFMENSNGSQGNNIFIVDNSGKVKLTHSKLGINEIDINQGEGSFIDLIGEKYVGRNIIRINDDNLLVLLSENYIDNELNIILLGAILSGIIFIMLIKSRVEYISNLSKSVRKIAKGNLATRIELKYQNELKTLGEDINYMAGELQREENYQKEFITNISHDLRTPLTTMLGYSKMIEDGNYDNQDELKKYVGIINKKGQNLKLMIDEFFDYSKLSSNDMNIEKVLVNLNEMILQLISEEEVNLQMKNLSIEVELEKSKIFTYADPVLIYRAFENLINNAIKYSKESTVISISLKSENIEGVDYGVLYVENIPNSEITKANIENLFKRLYKVDKSRSNEGSGLGLVITKEIVKLHNGVITARLKDRKIILRLGLIKEEVK